MKLQKKPWIDNEIQDKIKKREKLRRKFIKAKDKTTRDKYHSEYKEIRNQIVTLCREKKKEYYQNYFTNNSKDLRNTWRGINEIIKIKEKRKPQPSSILIDDQISNDPTKVANAFN